MKELSLFTGAGGGIWGSKLLGWRTIGYVEKEPYCQRVIAQRITDGLFDEAPIFGDIRAFNDLGFARRYRGLVDVVTAGFPCQPFSVAGKRLGVDDSRNMWPATIATIRHARPRFAFLENVPALLASGYFGVVLGDLAQAGYDAEWCVLGADDVGAPHRRKRLWMLAHSNNGGRGQKREFGVGKKMVNGDNAANMPSTVENSGAGETLADAQGQPERAGLCEGEQTGERGRRPGDQGGSEDVAYASSTRRQQDPGGAHGDESQDEGWSTEEMHQSPGDGQGNSTRDVAHPESLRRGQGRQPEAEAARGSPGRCAWWDIDPADLPYAAQPGPQGRREGLEQETAGREAAQQIRQDPTGCSREAKDWPVESRVGRVAHGMANRVKRLRALGNGQVPAVVATAWRLLSEGLIEATKETP